MSAGSLLFSSRIPTLRTSFETTNFTRLRPNSLIFSSKPLSAAPTRGPFVAATSTTGGGEDDFISKVLSENPSQVEPRFLVGERFLTLRDKQGSGKPPGLRILQLVKRLLGDSNGSSGKSGHEANVEYVSQTQSPVYLKEILREFKGQLYVPEEVFRENLSEEEEFERDIRELPLMSFEDFQKHLTAGKIKRLTSKSMVGVPPGVGYRYFIVDLNETPGDKNLQKTRWAIRLSASQAQAVLEEYKGAQYEIEKQMTAYVGKLAEYPHPVASSISSRIMVEFGMVTALMAAAAVVIAGFMASAAFAVTSFIYASAVYVLWPLVRPFVKFALGIFFNIAEGIWEYIADIYSDGGFLSKMYELYTFGGVSASLEVLKPILLVFLTMVLLVRFTLSRRPKNFRKWDIWQGIEFGQSKPQARVDGSTGVTFNDVAGIDEAVEELQELVRYLKNPDLFDKMGIKPPHGVLLEGPPGCGKTLVAKAIAGEAGVPFYQMAGSEFVEVLVGVGSARIRDLFKRAKVNKPSVVFIDEIDALATRRQGIFKESTNHLYNAATQERETTLNQLLIELDGFDTGKGVIFLGATNRRDLLDPALLRPGRFDRKIRIHPPGAKGRLDILMVHARKIKLSPTVDLASYAQNLPGWTGAKLAQLMQEAALVAVRNKHESVMQSDMDEAVDRLTIGPKKVGIDLGHQGQCRRAITEVGIAITSHLLRRHENAKVEYCERISIVPRGQTLSQIVFHRLDEEFYMFEKRPQLLHRLQLLIFCMVKVLLGGRAAEEVIFGRDTSKASVKYLEDATCLARKMLTIWNLENPMTIHGEPFPWKKKAQFIGPRLDFEGSLYDDYDFIEPPINFDLDDQVARRTEELIHDMYGKTVTLLRQHFTALLKTIKVIYSHVGYGIKADIWSFGITALELAYGRPPLAHLPPSKSLLARVTSRLWLDDAKRYYEGKKKLSKAFRDMVAACLSQDPSSRPSAEKLLRHPFFKNCRSQGYLVKTILRAVPPLEQRFDETKEINDGGTLTPKTRRVSGWNFCDDGFEKRSVFAEESFDDEEESKHAAEDAGRANKAMVPCNAELLVPKLVSLLGSLEKQREMVVDVLESCGGVLDGCDEKVREEREKLMIEFVKLLQKTGDELSLELEREKSKNVELQEELERMVVGRTWQEEEGKE